jgi:lysophospholipase L1-like esterase
MRILMLGNSLTSSHELPQLLAKLTGAHVEAITRGGARLSEFANPATKSGAATKVALGNNWDFVILQDMSHLPASNPQRHAENVATLAILAREAGATPVVYATWAYQPGTPRLTKLFSSYEEMAARMIAGAREAARASEALLIPVGQAFYDAADPSLYAADGIHPSAAGAQLAARMIAATLLEASMP